MKTKIDQPKTSPATINETIEQLHESLREYIEAAYHVSDPDMVKQRRELLDEPSVISQLPYLESTPRYIGSRKFKAIVGLDPAASGLFTELAKSSGENKQVLYDPPYRSEERRVGKECRSR